MNDPEIEAALALARERWRTLFPVKDERAELTSWYPPYFVRNIGLVASMHISETGSFGGPSADFVVVPLARMHEPRAALDELAATLTALAARGVSSALGVPLEETLGLARATVTEATFTPDEATVRRRREALALMYERFPAVAQRMQEVYGLRLPRYLATFAAFWRSLDEAEWRGMDDLGRAPDCIMVWFEDRGLSRRTRDGLDPRLECRYRSDPPEFVRVMWGDTDALHHGLWYDDPADPPTYIAHNYAHDTAETWRDEEPTPLAVLTTRARERIADPTYPEQPAPLTVHAVLAALEWFAEEDRAALAEDPPAKRWLEADRIPTLGTFGPALPPGAGTVRVGSPEARRRVWRSQPERARQWIESAKRECAEGKPGAALTFGHDLHWLDAKEYHEDALELLVCAYERLGRHALAEIAKVHYAHRDLARVAVFLPDEDGTEVTPSPDPGSTER
ncbi:ADP-ribosylation family protein [Polyangium sp. 15x6]|uniref:ADP-ribosylation family protein n=1 Tax=Polyangium sp. 15x6 TaxID=3042687 RepID=UPI00249B153D|nr:ADP-ribosylation family protein [Polyangium sp. 15x6]MDI3288161.1 DUF2228 domain-containing protein [Polyangium sp. 15x6]